MTAASRSLCAESAWRPHTAAVLSRGAGTHQDSQQPSAAAPVCAFVRALVLESGLLTSKVPESDPVLATGPDLHAPCGDDQAVVGVQMQVHHIFLSWTIESCQGSWPAICKKHTARSQAAVRTTSRRSSWAGKRC